MLNIIQNWLNKGKLLWRKHLFRLLKILYFCDTIFAEQIHNELLTNIQEEFNMKTTNRQVENTLKLHAAAKEPSCEKKSDSDNEFVAQRFVCNGNVVTTIGSRKAMSAISENRETGNE